MAPRSPHPSRLPATASGPLILPAEHWRALQDAHEVRVDALLRDHLDRARCGRPHPVDDFLFTYYTLRPGQLRRWHPGFASALADAPERAGWRFHRLVDPETALVGVDVSAFLAARGDQLRFIRRLLTATVAAPAHFGCFGLHEWAMVYRQEPAAVRHAGRPLRLGPAGTDDVLAGHQVKCSHYDAFRFFTAAARPRNLTQPTLAGRVGQEQPGCLHAAMDVYKWAYRMLPIVPSDLVVDAFELARSIREVDMRASPYDMTDLGLAPIRIETAAGKAQYVAAQRGFAERAQDLRRRLLGVLTALGSGTVR